MSKYNLSVSDVAKVLNVQPMTIRRWIGERPPPHELSPSAYRPGDPRTWEQFDRAVRQWQDAWQSGSTTTVAQALRRLSTLTEMLADEIHQVQRDTASTKPERDRDVPRAIGR